MTNTTESWFVTERSEALAGLLFTSHKDIRIRHKQEEDNTTAFLVEIATEEPPATRVFAVQVKGALSSTPGEWMDRVQPLFPSLDSPGSLLVCVVVVDVRENKAFYAWATEPRVEDKGATLHFPETPTFRPLETDTVSEISDRVRAWYDALPRQLTPTG